MNKDPNPSDHESNLILDCVNNALKRMGSDLEYIKTPEYFPEYEVLKDKKIVIVDDVLIVLENMLPDFVVATDGKADAIYHENQSLNDLVLELISMNPDILILDYNLSKGITGVDIMEGLSKLGFKGKFIGNSSESKRSEEFIKNGAIGNIDKTVYPTSDMVKDLIKILDK